MLSVFPAIVLVLALLPHTGLTEADLLSAPARRDPICVRACAGVGRPGPREQFVPHAHLGLCHYGHLVVLPRRLLHQDRPERDLTAERESRGYVYTRLGQRALYRAAACRPPADAGAACLRQPAYRVDRRKACAILRLLSRVLRFRGLVLFALLTLLFWAILCVFPNRRIPLLRALPGAAGASLGWLVFSSLFSVYVQHFGSYSVFYGSLAGIAMAMLWLYVCMSILFYGGVLNCLLFERRSQQGK